MIPFSGLISFIVGILGLINNWKSGETGWFIGLLILEILDFAGTTELKNVLSTKGDCQEARRTAVQLGIIQLAIIVIGIGSFM